MIDSHPTVDWHAWLQRWDAQQLGHLPQREARFAAMLDVLEVLLPDDFTALDLACGPGAISQRILARFPRARCIAVDVDPVLLAIGQGALGSYDGRLRWVDADLRASDWAAQLDIGQVDAVLSTTALHWLPAHHLVRLYNDLGQLVRPGGLVLNGDNMAFGPQLPTFRTLISQLYKRTSTAARDSGVESWWDWWAAVAAEPGLQRLLAERARRNPEASHGVTSPVFDLHTAALGDAGFREIGVIWQQLDDRVLLAVK